MSMFIGKQIEITSINPSVRSISMIIHVYCSDHFISTAQRRIPILAQNGVQYLAAEGFLDDIHDVPWLTYVTGFIHP